jgi:hypothetical protein
MHVRSADAPRFTGSAMRRASVVFAGALLAVWGLADSAQTQDPEPDTYRVEHVYQGAVVARVACAGDVCEASLPEAVEATFPASMGDVDVTASLTLEYRTSPSDAPLLNMRIQPTGGQKERMRPGSLAIRAGQRTVTTLTWVKQGLDPTLGPFEFSWGFEASHLLPPFTVTATEAVVVIEAAPV